MESIYHNYLIPTIIRLKIYEQTVEKFTLFLFISIPLPEFYNMTFILRSPLSIEI